MRIKLLAGLLPAALLLTAYLAFVQQPTRVQVFSPQGTVKRVRQVRVQFSEPMVPFGDPRSADPFNINCTEKGAGRWADPSNWAFDFDRDLPAGIQCEFSVRDDLKSLSGNGITGQRVFRFSTGGPSVINTHPYQGTFVTEDQIFVLELNGDVNSDNSVLTNVSFSIQNISEKVGVRIVSGQERESILDVIFPPRYHITRPEHLLLIQAKQKFPADSKVNLVWGKGVSSPNGITNEQDQILPYSVQRDFSATFHCQRENSASACIPIADMRLTFSSPVPWKTAKLAVLKGPEGKQWKPKNPDQNRIEEEGAFVSDVTFKGPFPENSIFTLQVPQSIEDESGRKLSNARRFPLTIRTAEYPPLAKFAADFGILEWKADALLPVTLRNVEPEISAKEFEVPGGEDNIDPLPPRPANEELDRNLTGKFLRVPADKSDQMIAWISKVSERRWEDRDKSVFGPVTTPKANSFTLPKLQGSKAFEVIGIPFKKPGFYVVEIKSEILGAALLGKKSKSMYVPTTVLVTNLSVHFKWGAESSLAWVTTLDGAKPVKQASLQARDCEGKVRWQGSTDANGIARMQVPQEQDLPRCSHDRFGSGLTITAQTQDDMAFLHSSWDEGIEKWRFRLPTEWGKPNFATAHTIMDRSLFRAGETVHMKHVLRREALAGFVPEPPDKTPEKIVIQHLGSEQKYEFPLKWDSQGIAETTWSVPKEAKLGIYQITLTKSKKEYPPWGEAILSGSFRVEEYRVPLMRAVIRPPSGTLVNPGSVPVDVTVSYLNGGGAGNMPVKLRYDVKQRYISEFDDYEGFVFSNGVVKEGLVRSEYNSEPEQKFELKSIDLTLDKTGSVHTTITQLPPVENPMQISAELEYRDPSGETQTVSSRIPLWPAERVVGIQPNSWMQSKNALGMKAAVLDLRGKPVSDAPVKVDIFQRKYISHRKRLVGGFYAYEHLAETKFIGNLCEGKTDKNGLFSCTKPSPISGNLILQATTTDSGGRKTTANYGIWIAGEDEWWFEVKDDDRIDILPEKKRYEPGEKARFQVRMPFRKATALVTIEREGVGEAFVKELSGKEPVIEIPVKNSYSPNIFVSVLVVRGRVSGVQPTATVDLGRPAFKLGISEINVGWKSHELKVKVEADRSQYKVREKAKIQISVTTPEGAPPKGAEVAVAAVDEGLLELKPNESWDLLDSMMGRRSYNVQTSTAQMHVIGKRHFGLKALPQGGGGGAQRTRELFETLLLWKARVKLDEKGLAAVEVPLNDSLTSFRIVAVATAGMDRFGTGSTSIRSTQDLMIMSGIAPVVRQGDKFRSTFTVRNTTERPLEVRIAASVSGLVPEALPPQQISLGSGESKEISWNVTAPVAKDSLKYVIDATSGEGTSDRLSVTQRVVPPVQARTFQATLLQLSGDSRVQVERPKDAIPGLGGIDVSFQPTLVSGMSGLTEYMKQYPYTCLEQDVSKAISLQDVDYWNKIVAQIPAYLDSDGLLKYFPSMTYGSDALTAYVLSISQEAGYALPADIKQKIVQGLRGFIEGRVIRSSSLPTVDLSLRKLAAIEAISRTSAIEPSLLSSIRIEPNLWPTSGVIDWYCILGRTNSISGREAKLREAEQILRNRLNFQATTMNFSTERTDCLWWLMISPDENAVRLVLGVLNDPNWKADIPRLVRGTLARQKRGHWDTTVANAWGVLAMKKFSGIFEKTPVTGTSSAELGSRVQTLEWNSFPQGKSFLFNWPAQKTDLSLQMSGTGQPWATVRSIAAIPVTSPISSGFKIKKSITAIEQKQSGVWSKGDIVRIRLELESQSDMTWVVVNDPIPAGAAILGTGLGRDSQLTTRGEKSEGWAWPAFQERSLEAFRAYYEFVPKGTWVLEYTVRFNNEGTMNLPSTRVEAMYSPEMFGEIPNQPMSIQ
jgi:alpha-2-macroglobulin